MLKGRRAVPGPAPATRWYGALDALHVAGVEIAAPFAYAGEGLSAVHDTGGEAEPAVIEVSMEVTFPAGRPPVPSELGYRALDTDQRGYYLSWLAASPPPDDSPPWAVRLQVAGIERRLLVDHRHTDLSNELPELLDRLQVLHRLDAATGDADLRRSIAQLIAAIVGWPTVDAPPPVPVMDLEMAEALPDSVEIFFGWHGATGHELPAETIVNAVRHLAGDWLPPEADGCRDDFDVLYALRLAESGLSHAPSTETEAVEVRLVPSSNSFKLPIAVPLRRLPPSDVASWIAQALVVAARCGAELSSYSRWCHLHPVEDKAVARAVLMPVVLGGSLGSALPGLVELLDDRCGVDVVGSLLPDELNSLWPLARDVTTDVADYLDVVRFLDRAGFGLVPDPRFGDQLLPDPIMAFRVSDQTAATAGLLRQLESLRLAWLLIVSDGRVTDAEVWRLEDRLSAQRVALQADRDRILATHAWHRARPDHGFPAGARDTALAYPELAISEPSEREALGRLLVALACSDALLADEELIALDRVFRQLGLDAEVLDRLLRSFTSVPSPESVPSTLPLPPPVSDAASTVLAAVESQIEAATALDDERADPESAREPEAVSPSVSASTPAGRLSGSARLVLADLQGRDVVTLDEARSIARCHDAMWGDLTETINDLAIDLTGELAIDEEGSQVRIDARVLEELLR
jgi:TerB-C domain/TerB N-terminal domain